MVKHKQIVLYSDVYNGFFKITDEVKNAVTECNIKDGVVFVISAHTTSGIIVNESLECVESDMNDLLCKLVPEDGNYAHAHFLYSYGAMAGNPTGHLKSLICGNHCIFPLMNGELLCGAAQEIYFAEFDGPRPRTITITVIGD